MLEDEKNKASFHIFAKGGHAWVGDLCCLLINLNVEEKQLWALRPKRILPAGPHEKHT